MTFEVRVIHFRRNVKGNRNGKILNDNKNNKYTLQCSYIIAKIYYWYFNFKLDKNILTGRFFGCWVYKLPLAHMVHIVNYIRIKMVYTDN